MIDVAWILDDSPHKQGRIWSAQRDSNGIGRPPWTPGDCIAQSMFEAFVRDCGNVNRQYLFLHPESAGPNAD
jgi:hypothetical protein